MSALREILAALLLVGGAGVVSLAAIGVARLPDPFSRMHAAAKAGVAGAGLLLLGTGLAFGTVGALLTALAAVAFLVLTAPLASHALGRAAYVGGAPLGAASVADALSGVLTRRVFDIDPARTARQRPAARMFPGKDNAMSAIPEFRHPAGPAHREVFGAEPIALRRVLCCLVGGAHQAEATTQAITLARQSGATVTGLSGVGLEPNAWRGPLPVGGAFWADRLAARSRARLRETASAALQQFQAMTAAEPGLDVVARHEEVAGPQAQTQLLAGQDLVILPAGMGRHGTPAEPAEEVAASLGATRVLPVLRVRRHVAAPREVLLVIGPTPACAGLAAGLLRSGLWPSAPVSILPVSDDHAGLAGLVEAQEALLRAHGRRVVVLPPADRDTGRDELAARLRRFEAAVMSCLSTHGGGFLDSLRPCVHEAVSDRVPLILLP